MERLKKLAQAGGVSEAELEAAEENYKTGAFKI